MRKLLYSTIANSFLAEAIGRFFKIDKTYLLPKDNSSFYIPYSYRLMLEFHSLNYGPGLWFGWVSKSIYRDTNVSLVLYGKDRNESAVVGFDIEGDVFCIRQLQSRQYGKNILPKKWERILLESAINFGRELGFKQVQVQRAEDNRWCKKGDEDFLNRLRMRYNVTVRRSGFTLDDKLGVWVLNLNPQ